MPASPFCYVLIDAIPTNRKYLLYVPDVLAYLRGICENRLWKLRRFHHPLPLSVSEYGDDDIKCIERSLERNVLVEIKCACHHVNYNPDDPLLEIFACQSPNAYETKCRGKGVGSGYSGVGAIGKEEVERTPDDERCDAPYYRQSPGEMSYRLSFLSILVK